MRILGIDASTSTIGKSIIDFDDKGKAKLIYIDYYKPIKNTMEDKNKDILFMLSEAKKDIDCLIAEYNPDHLAIEDFIRYLAGGSGSATILSLASLNRTICLLAYENYPAIPLHICNVMSIRTQIKKDIGRKDLPGKEEIPDIMEKILKISIPRPTKKTRKGIKELEEVGDMADSLAVAYYCYRKLQGGK